MRMPRVLAGVSAALLCASPALAGTATKLAFSAYLRAAPSQASAVLDEVEHDKVVEVLGEAPGWRHVRWGGHEGFIDAAAFSPAPPRPAGGAACVAAKLADDQAHRNTRLCGAGPPAPPHRPPSGR